MFYRFSRIMGASGQDSGINPRANMPRSMEGPQTKRDLSPRDLVSLRRVANLICAVAGLHRIAQSKSPHSRSGLRGAPGVTEALRCMGYPLLETVSECPTSPKSYLRSNPATCRRRSSYCRWCMTYCGSWRPRRWPRRLRARRCRLRRWSTRHKQPRNTQSRRGPGLRWDLVWSWMY